MKFRDRDDDELSINLTPLIDVVFLLLIFFMVSTTFSKESRIAVDLPETSSDPDELREDTIDVEIGAQGGFAVRGPGDASARPLVNAAPETLMRALSEAAGPGAETTVVIRADRRTPHELVVRVMDVARRLDLLNITFATQGEAASDANR